MVLKTSSVQYQLTSRNKRHPRKKEKRKRKVMEMLPWAEEQCVQSVEGKLLHTFRELCSLVSDTSSGSGKESARKPQKEFPSWLS